MSYSAIRWTYSSPSVLEAGLKPAELAVLRALCWFYKDKDQTKYDHNCYPSVATIARMIGATTSTVDRAKRVLAKKRLVAWDRAANFDEKGRQTNSYRINCPELEKLLEANEKARKAKMPQSEWRDDDDEPARPYRGKPGEFFSSPDLRELAASFSPALDVVEAHWLCKALEFARDTPENRQKIHDAFQKAANLGACERALERVLRNCRQGRLITNRLGYLLVAMRRECARNDARRTGVTKTPPCDSVES